MNRRQNVLIVEYDEMNRLVMLSIFNDLYSCECAIHGRDVLQRLDSKVYDLILMDIHLGNGKLNGEILMRIIKANPANYYIKMIAITSTLKETDRKRFLRSGFDTCFLKPIQRDVIIETIHNLFTTRLHKLSDE